MNNDAFLDKVSSIIEISVHHPSFYPQLFALLEGERGEPETEAEKLVLEQYDVLSQDMEATKLQDACQARNVLRTRAIALHLIDEGGDLQLERLEELVACLENHLYTLGPGRRTDRRRQEHLLRTLKALLESKELQGQLQRISQPISHAVATQVIRDTLGLQANDVVSDGHTRQAALAAWLCFIRQNVGSCFATAPAIVIHDEQPEAFLRDIDELLSTGSLKRTYGGVEYAVPISLSWGIGDLKRPIMLTGSEEDSVAMWKAPGFVAGLVEAELIDSSEEEAKSWFDRAFQRLSNAQPAVASSAEALFEEIFLEANGITRENLEEYKNRPKEMAHSGLMILAPKKSKGGVGGACQKYLEQVKAAARGFKLLTENALLKTWEFTLASFAETQHDLCRWNLYASLGMAFDDEGGIGWRLYHFLNEKVEILNEESRRHQEEYDPVYIHVKSLESRLRRASEEEARFLKAEYRARSAQLQSIAEMRDQAHNKARLFTQLYDYLLAFYDDSIRHHFQEVYDADMHEVETGPYDDSPAGFRLLYKHGRVNTSAWTMIRTPQEFVDALAGYFVATESDVLALEQLSEAEDDVRDLVTALVTHVKTPEFLESAFDRMAVAHRSRPVKNPLENLEKVEKKPWSYTSGGTMDTLVACYYRRESKPTAESRWIEEPAELLAFLIECIKKVPKSKQDEFLKEPHRSLLMHSPTHAFLLKPGWKPFNEGWQRENYTYTWIRDQLVNPLKMKVKNLRLDQEMMKSLIERIAMELPAAYRHGFRQLFPRLPGSMTPSEFRGYVVRRCERQGGAGIVSGDEMDALLYESLPMCDGGDVRRKVRKLLEHLPEMSEERLERLMELFERFFDRYDLQMVTSQELQNTCKSLLLLEQGKTTSSRDLHLEIAIAASEAGLAMQRPMLFADTNWVKHLFGFVLNPGTEELDFWRFDELGQSGAPMSAWKMWLDGSRKKPEWGVYTQPQEYC